MACPRHPKRRKTGALPLSLRHRRKGSPLARRTSLYFSREKGGKDTASEGSRRMSAPIRRAKPVQNRVLRARPAEFHSACVPMHPPLPYARRALTALNLAEYAKAAAGCGNSASHAKNGATITGSAIHMFNLKPLTYEKIFSMPLTRARLSVAPTLNSSRMRDSALIARGLLVAGVESNHPVVFRHLV